MSAVQLKSIGVVQPQNYQGRRFRPLRERSPLEEELTAKGIPLLIVNGLLQCRGTETNDKGIRLAQICLCFHAYDIFNFTFVNYSSTFNVGNLTIAL